MQRFKYFFLLRQLISRDFKVKYKRSVLGVLWSFLNPLLMMSVQYIVFSNLFRYDIKNYVVYLLTGIVIFNYFSDTTSQCLMSILGNSPLITKVYLPKYIFPLSKVLSCGINFCVSLIPLFIIALISKVHFSYSLLLIPINALFLLTFVYGVGLILSVLMVYFRDIQFLWGVVVTAWMYATPIFYPASIIPSNLHFIQTFNPIFHIINFLRIIVIDGTIPSPSTFYACILSSVVFLFIGGLFYKKVSKNITLYL